MSLDLILWIVDQGSSGHKISYTNGIRVVMSVWFRGGESLVRSRGCMRSYWQFYRSC
jgi:hypothetical protein